MAISINDKYYDFDSVKDVISYLLEEEYYEDLCEGDIESLKEQLREARTIIENHYKENLKINIIETEIENTDNITDDEIFEVINSYIEDYNEECYLSDLLTKKEVVKLWKENNM